MNGGAPSELYRQEKLQSDRQEAERDRALCSVGFNSFVDSPIAGLQHNKSCHKHLIPASYKMGMQRLVIEQGLQGR
jgi:hypothetical protein